jgi:hypothetical protein
MKTKILLSIGLLVVVFLSRCAKFDEINTNPNATVKVTSAMLATTLIQDITKQSTQKSFMQPYMLAKYIIWTENVEGYQYNRFGRTGLGYVVLNNVDKMVEFATTEELRKSYLALGHFVKAYKFFHATMDVGDVPYSQALKAESDGIFNPEYDSQKEVLLGVLSELDIAEKLFAEGVNFDGDPVYSGNVSKWRRLTNSFALHVLIQLSKKSNDSDLNIKSRFQDIVNNKPIFESNEDNFQLIHSDKSGQMYPFYKVGNNFTIYPMLSAEIIDLLKKDQDRRVFYYASPSPVQIQNGKTQSEFDAYIGIDPSASFAEITDAASSRDYSRLNDRYVEIPVGEPTYRLSYAQTCFTIAEASVRGWITQDADEYYKKGIEAAMRFVADNTPNESRFNHGMEMTNDYILTFAENAGASFLSTSVEEKIEKIIVQKYISSYLQSPFIVYYDYRRTGFPKFKINPSTNLNEGAIDKWPMRWMYEQGEYNQNAKNVLDAVRRQFDGNDDVNQLMWLLRD